MGGLSRGVAILDASFLQKLACPRCDSRPPLVQKGEVLVCTVCGYGYRIVEGIPHLLVEEAIEPKDLKEKTSGSND